MEDKLGKIDHRLFENIIFSNCGYSRKEVSTGPAFGVDVSIVDIGDGLAMAITSDPLSLVPSLGLAESAWLSVHLMANDMATTGFAPMYGQFVLNLPAGFSKDDFKIYWQYIHQYAKSIGVAITGGHTGFIEGQHSTIAGGGTFFTVAPKAKMLTSKMARPGDSILVTKTCALSSAAILALSFPEAVKGKLGKEVYEEAAQSFYQTSSLKDAIAAAGSGENFDEITAMHDVTEGGVLGAIYELAVASNNGAVVYNDLLPVGDTQARICSLFELDPGYCIGAGSMIICCKKGTADPIIKRLNKEGIPCVEVGQIRNKASGIKLKESGVEKDLIYMEEDPYWAAFFKALKAGWK